MYCRSINDIKLRGNNFFTNYLYLPKFMTAHIKDDEVLRNILHQTTKNMLVIYLHRKETQRLKSAIKHVAQTRICGRFDQPERKYGSNIWTYCSIDKNIIINEFIQKRTIEVGLGAYKILTRKTHDTIENNTPGIIFISY